MSEINKEKELANNFINYTGVNVFLTGKAGTGKTTFLKNLKMNSSKQMAILAPTGVAAINASGVTIHSFFQLPFSPYIPGSQIRESGNKFQNKFSKVKISIIQALDLLVIDEVSMVRSDLMDAIDHVLRKYRNPALPFGGLQLLLIGDIQQLSPVVSNDEWTILSEYYESPYFFHSKALQSARYVTIELKTIYRQSDPDFVNILNAVRDNRLTKQLLDKLNKRYIPDFKSDSEQGFIRLTTHNSQAASINNAQLEEIDEPRFVFNAEVSGNFPSYSYPTEESLVLKKGAQVMFIKNDITPMKRYYNGKIGIISSIGSGAIIVDCNGEKISVEPQEWINYKYAIDKKSSEIKESIDGKFKQYPLKTAWAITIHKSQGLTFDNVIINASLAFAHGQVYVALSRCRTLEGIVLDTPVSAGSIMNNDIIDSYTQFMHNNEPDNSFLATAKDHYFLNIVSELFDYSKISKLLHHYIRICDEHLYRLYPTYINVVKQIALDLETHLSQVSIKFLNQLKSICSGNNDLETNLILKERISKGIDYFYNNTAKYISEVLGEDYPSIDNKELNKQLTNHFTQLLNEINLKLAVLESMKEGIDI